jgi:Fic family protein
MTPLPFTPLETISAGRFETSTVLTRVASAAQFLGELKGVTTFLPNEGILINTLSLQEAKESSAIENIVTTHDELFRDARLPEDEPSPAVKEVLRYARALRVGFEAVGAHRVLTNNHILQVQAALELNNAGYRKLPGTALKNQHGEVVYTPPDPTAVIPLMTDLEQFINDHDRYPAHPLVKMAMIHQRFEALHPFYDGNGRTGRIINVLYLMMHDLLKAPVLYMSRYIIATKSDYYRLLREVTECDAWEAWVLYMLEIVERSAQDAVRTVIAIREAFMKMKQGIRSRFPRMYSQDLLNVLFAHPYTKIDFIREDLGVSRLTAAKYLNRLSEPDAGFLVKRRYGRSNYYINPALYEVLTGAPLVQPSPAHRA